ncbi:MAG: ABC transporter permease [Candidatus Neomarinimicrobiota bacterium]|tara:strand:+ start:994 stop:1980 length:987 start_codon:yes stop_codon:yes gene_type:complete
MNKSVLYIARRLGFYLVAAFAALTLNFIIPRLMPGDPASIIFARFKGKLKPEAIDAMRESFGLTNDPVFVQYVSYLKGILKGDLGTSIAYFPEPVSEIIGSGLVWTIFLAGSSMVIAFFIGTILGIILAWNRTGKLDSFLPPALAFFGAFPYFWLAMVFLYLFGFSLNWFPTGRAYGDEINPGYNLPFFISTLYHAFLPALTLVFVSLGGWMLSMRNTMISTLGSDYITFAHAKGIPSKLIMLRYAARNAILPNLTGFGMALGFMLSGALLTEMIFSYPGQGFLLLQAVQTQDYPLMQGIFMTITLAVLGANWLVDIAILFFDPRTRK